MGCDGVEGQKCFIPVIMVSGRRTGSGDVAYGYSCGAAYYFSKPLDRPKLLSVVRDLFGDPTKNEIVGAALRAARLHTAINP